MSINVNNRSALQIKVVSTNGSIRPSTSAQAVTVKSASGVSTAAARLDALQDVVEDSPTNGSTLVYDVTTDKYIVKQLDLDGGIF
jgi:hypothetical protein